MKDKLEKHGRSRGYMIFRKVIVFVALGFLLGSTIVVPVTVNAIRGHKTQLVVKK